MKMKQQTIFGETIENVKIDPTKIILLDLNYTLVANSKSCYGAYPKRIYQQKYETELIDMVKDNYVILITARPIDYKEETLDHIKKLTGFEPNTSYWNIGKGAKGMQPHHLKEYWLDTEIFKKYGDNPDKYYAIESNAMTRRMYNRRGIEAHKKQELMAKYM